ncbi:MAG: hypothetical protein AUG07_00615 [Acidobacteria bacterium 13_1_20CM_2_60_10]|nr:MAG: hypothetical protein AUG07_00615 [Acidobacteria bacterium 13_1_20CM_2_60_10]
MLYQLGWTTEPGLRGLSVSEFRAVPANENAHVPGGQDAVGADERVVVEFASEVERDEFLRRLEEHFATRRFTNAADAFDTVKAYVLEHAVKR